MGQRHYWLRKKPNPKCKDCGGDGSVMIRKRVWVWIDEDCQCCKEVKPKGKVK